MTSRECVEAVMRVLAPDLRSRGFRRRGYHWYRRRGEAVQVVGLCPDPTAPGWVELWLGVWWALIPPMRHPLRPLQRHPRIADCHFRVPLSALLGQGGAAGRTHATDPMTAHRQLLRPLALVGYPWLHRLSQLDWAIAALRGAEPTPAPMGSLRWMYQLACLLVAAGEVAEASTLADAITFRDPRLGCVVRKAIAQRQPLAR